MADGSKQCMAGDDPNTGSYTWQIEKFTRLAGRKLYSDTFKLGTYSWRMLVIPPGNKTKFLSVYLDAPEAPYMPLHTSPKASFKLVLVNQVDASKSYVKDASHTFTPTEVDWGFTHFAALGDILPGGYVVNDTVILKVEITVKKDERCACDTRKETGCVGLKNHGDTCCMNPLLQYLFYVPYFRKAVYHMPTSGTDEPSQSILIALQSLFYKLQYSRTNVSTKDLMKSFGWGTYDAFMHHDVQQLKRELFAKLEEQLKGTKVENVINELFEGRMEYKSTRQESFMDLALDIKGCKNIYESLARYCEVTVLDGENKYEARNFGLQDARKNVLFVDFPPVLNLHLKRFEYDVQRDMMVKINDRYEFYDEIDLDIEDGRYLSPDADRSIGNKYRLHSVLVHSGRAHSGHYCAFVRPDGENWLKFDDEHVTKEESTKAIEEQWGGETEMPAAQTPGYKLPPIKFTKDSNACMLVYVRVADWQQVMCDVTKDDIAEHLRTRVEAEQGEKERRQKEKAEAHLYCHVKIARDEDIKEQVGNTRFFDLVDHDKCPTYRIQKQTKFRDFKRMVEKELHVPVERQRYWTWARRQNQTFRPMKYLGPQDEEQPLMNLREPSQGLYKNKYACMELKLFLEVPPNPDMALPKIAKREWLLFFKFYNPEPMKETLTYVGHNYTRKNMKLADLFPLMCRMAGLPDNTELEASEEIKFEPAVMIEKIDKKCVLSQLEDGDIIIFQKLITPAEESEYRFPRAENFLEYIHNRRLVNFRKLEDPKAGGLSIELLKDLTYDDVCEKLAEQLPDRPDPTRLRLTQHNTYSDRPQRNPIKFRLVSLLENMLQHGNHQSAILYYEVLDMPELKQLETPKAELQAARLAAPSAVETAKDEAAGTAQTNEAIVTPLQAPPSAAAAAEDVAAGTQQTNEAGITQLQAQAASSAANAAEDTAAGAQQTSEATITQLQAELEATHPVQLAAVAPSDAAPVQPQAPAPTVGTQSQPPTPTVLEKVSGLSPDMCEALRSVAEKDKTRDGAMNIVATMAWNFRGLRGSDLLLTTTGRIDEVRAAMALGATHVRILGRVYHISGTKRHVGNVSETWMQLRGWERGVTPFNSVELLGFDTASTNPPRYGDTQT